jgi:resuscitation-promoting factor RpfB
MTKKLWFWQACAALSLVLLLLGLYLLLKPVPVTLIINGETREHATRLREPGLILAEAGIGFHPQDSLTPAPGSRVPRGGVITLESARWVQVWEDGELQAEFFTPERIPAQHLLEAGIDWTENSRLLYRGEAVDVYDSLPRTAFYLLEIRRPASFNGELTHAPTVLSALWEQGVTVSSADDLSADWAQSPAHADSVHVRQARPVSVMADGVQIDGFSAARTVGGVLADLGLPLQSLDRVVPPLEAAPPEEGMITVTHVREAVQLAHTASPFGSTMVPDPETLLDTRSLISPGQSGIDVTRTRVVFEDGVEQTAFEEETWQAAAPQDEVVGYGQQINVRTIDTEYGPLEVYREVTMYATSYHPCGFKDRCSYTTRNGCTLEKGVVAVSAAWYPYMVGQRVYIPGYGIGLVCDSGGGIPGRHWIDLGYSDDDYRAWYHWVPVYFLTPVPDTVLWLLP